jgi:hypothetical protein
VLNIIIDADGGVISAGIKLDVEWKFGATITSWDILADQTGSIIVDVLKSNYAGYPPTVSIAGTEKPFISTDTKNQDTSLTSFETTVTSGDIWRFSVDSSPTSITRVTIAFAYTRTS